MRMLPAVVFHSIVPCVAHIRVWFFIAAENSLIKFKEQYHLKLKEESGRWPLSSL
jgi:hypothetical protein